MDKNIEYYHNAGKMPVWAWAQLNGRTAQQNYEYQKAQIKESKRLEELKRELEVQTLAAIINTLEAGSDIVAEQAANDFAGYLSAAIGSPSPVGIGKTSFSAQLGAMLGAALGAAPFKLLEELFNDDEKRRR